MNKRESDLMCIGYILSAGNCRELACHSGFGRTARNKVYKCPLYKYPINDETIADVKCYDTHSLKKRTTKWIEENKITKEELFPYLFEGETG